MSSRSKMRRLLASDTGRTNSARTRKALTKSNPAPTPLRRTSRSNAGTPSERFDPTGSANVISQPRVQRRVQLSVFAGQPPGEYTLTHKSARKVMRLASVESSRLKLEAKAAQRSETEQTKRLELKHKHEMDMMRERAKLDMEREKYQKESMVEIIKVLQKEQQTFLLKVLHQNQDNDSN